MTPGIPEGSRFSERPTVALAVVPLWRHSPCNTSGPSWRGRCEGSMMLGKTMFDNELRGLLLRAAIQGACGTTIASYRQCADCSPRGTQGTSTDLEPQGGPMMKTHATVDWTSGSIALALLILSHGCIDDDPAEPPRAGDVDAVEAAPGFQDLGESQLMLDLAQEIPGFGGLYYEPGGERLVITMTEATRAGFPAARQAVIRHLAADVAGASRADIPRMDFVERVVGFSFIELARYRARLRPALFGIPEVVSLAVDEEFNRISIGPAGRRYAPCGRRVPSSRVRPDRRLHPPDGGRCRATLLWRAWRSLRPFPSSPGGFVSLV